MYAAGTTSAAVPAPMPDSPAAGTTGNPNGGSAMGRATAKVGGMTPSQATIGWAVGALLVIVGARYVFKNGGLG